MNEKNTGLNAYPDLAAEAVRWLASERMRLDGLLLLDEQHRFRISWWW